MLAGALTALTIGSATPSARAFCRSTTCDDDGGCQPSTETCKPLFWKRTCIGFALQEDASAQISYDPLSDILDAAFSAWEQADCGGNKGPGIRVENLGPVACGAVEFNARKKGKAYVEGNANTIVFRDLAWPEDGRHKSIQVALTTVQFLTNTGEIVGADMEINSADHSFVEGTSDVVDLQAVITHEAGHFLGLAHSAIPEATMFEAINDQADFRTLHPDDIEGICTIYPPADLYPDGCNPIPRHGFSPDCADQQVVGCSVAPRDAPDDPSGPWLASAAAALAAAWCRTKRSGGKSRHGEEEMSSGLPAPALSR